MGSECFVSQLQPSLCRSMAQTEDISMIIGFIPSILRSAIMIKCCFHHILLTFSECSLIAATSRTCGPTPPTADFPHPYNNNNNNSNNNNRPWSGGWLWMAMDGYGWLRFSLRHTLCGTNLYIAPLSNLAGKSPSFHGLMGIDGRLGFFIPMRLF